MWAVGHIAHMTNVFLCRCYLFIIGFHVMNKGGWHRIYDHHARGQDFHGLAGYLPFWECDLDLPISQQFGQNCFMIHEQWMIALDS